jgi:Ca2+/Na+ antiporter
MDVMIAIYVIYVSTVLCSYEMVVGIEGGGDSEDNKFGLDAEEGSMEVLIERSQSPLPSSTSILSPKENFNYTLGNEESDDEYDSKGNGKVNKTTEMVTATDLNTLLRGSGGIQNQTTYHWNHAVGVMAAFDQFSTQMLSYIMPVLYVNPKSQNKESWSQTISSSPYLSSSSGPGATYLGTSGKVSVYRAASVLSVSIFYITVLVSLLINVSLVIMEILPLESSTVGGTLIAFGSQIPDIMGSVALARKGYSDAAIAGAISSQVINLTLGVALPALSLIMTGGKVKMVADEIYSIGLLTALVILVILAYVAAIIPCRKLSHLSQLPEHATLERRWSLVLFIIFCTSYAVFIAVNEG